MPSSFPTESQAARRLAVVVFTALVIATVVLGVLLTIHS